MSDEELFRTGRLQSLRSMAPAYLPGAGVFLQRDVQGFAKGSAARIVSVQSTRPGEFRYQLMVGEQKMWTFESDIRPTAPGELNPAAGSAADQPSLGPTQRMRTMTLSQRMAALGPNATHRMHALTQEERMRKMVQTNRLRTLGPELGGSGDSAALLAPVSASAAASLVAPLSASAAGSAAAPAADVSGTVSGTKPAAMPAALHPSPTSEKP